MKNIGLAYTLVLLGGILAVLMLCEALPAQSVGFQVFPASSEVYPNTLTCEDRTLFVRIHAGHRFHLNEDGPFDERKLIRELNKQLNYGDVRIAVLIADRNVAFGDLVDMVNSLYRDGVASGLTTNEVQSTYYKTGCLSIA